MFGMSKKTEMYVIAAAVGVGAVCFLLPGTYDALKAKLFPAKKA